jgi:hypothetical protein
MERTITAVKGFLLEAFFCSRGVDGLGFQFTHLSECNVPRTENSIGLHPEGLHRLTLEIGSVFVFHIIGFFSPLY